MILDIIQNITDYWHLKDQITCTQINSYTYDNIFIYKIGNMPTGIDGQKKQYKLNQSIIEQKKFNRLKVLKCCAVGDVKDVNHLADTLVELECSYWCGIDNDGVCKLKKLKKIDCSWNQKIYDLSHVADTLEVLFCRGKCGINQVSILKFENIKILDCSDNSKIYDVNHLYNTLKVLKCKSVSCIDMNGVSKLKNKLDKFVCDNNNNFPTYLYREKCLLMRNAKCENMDGLVEEWENPNKIVKNDGESYYSKIINVIYYIFIIIKNKIKI